ncbi:Autophagy-related protein 2 B [Schistosoma japonicum]|nr:Autophagy-related protein 2 B [Schistosoma japonicum]
MPPWGLAKKPVKLFLNFSLGQLLSQPLEDDQIIITSNGIGCKDIYFNIDKLNALLSESGIPMVFCVAYIAEVIICLPWSVEIKGVDFVVQALSEVSSPSGADELFNSMISSVSTAAFAVAKVAKNSTIPNNFFEENFTHTDDDSDLGDKERLPKGLHEQAYQFFENLTAAAETMSTSTNSAGSYVDQDSKQRIAHMIDSLIAQTSIVLRDVSIRVECELRLPGIDRASGLTLTIKHLSISNQYKTEEKQQPSQSHTSSGRWSWLWWWQANGKCSTSSSVNSASTPAGSLSTMLHKIIHLEEADLFWDLWSTSGQVQGCSSLSSSPDRSQPSCSSLPNKTCGPTADTLVSSAKLLTLSGSEHTARLSLRVGSALNVSHNPTPSHIQSDDLPCSMNDNISNSSTTNISDFQLRLHIDLGPIIACAYPSQFYWLHMMVGQLVHIYDDYAESRKSISQQTKLESDMTCYYSDLLTRNHLSNMMNKNNCINVIRSNLSNHDNDYSNFGDYQKPYSPMTSKLREANLIDLDLAPGTINPQNLTSTMLDSELFRSCLSDMSTTTVYGDKVTTNQHTDHHFLPKSNCNHDENIPDTNINDKRNCQSSIFDKSANHNNDSSPGSYPTVAGCTAALPGPSIFFGRFHGHIPTPNYELKLNSSNIHLGYSNMLHYKCQPFRINREDVDTGRMSPSEWVAHLKHQLSNMAYPRDHLW